MESIRSVLYNLVIIQFFYIILFEQIDDARGYKALETHQNRCHR